MSSALLALQGAVHAVLKPALAGMTTACALYDRVPPGAAKPYVAYGESTAADWSTMPAGADNGDGEEIMFMLHAWSEYAGNKEVGDIFGVIKSTLNNAALTPAGYALTYFRFDFARMIPDEDPKIRHGIMTFRAKVTG